LDFSYSLYPHSGDWNSGVRLESRHYALPLRAYQTMGAEAGVLSANKSFCSISQTALVISCLKQAEYRSTAILRLYNPAPEEKSSKANFAFPIKAAWETNLNEQRQKQIDLQESNGFYFSCPSNKIMTFEIDFSA